MGSMGTKTVIRHNDEELKNAWDAFAAQYENGEEALRALMKAHANDESKTESVYFYL